MLSDPAATFFNSTMMAISSEWYGFETSPKKKNCLVVADMQKLKLCYFYAPVSLFAGSLQHTQISVIIFVFKDDLQRQTFREKQ